MVEKYGFVYIWFDRKHKRYYVGCHWGNENDTYICSSNWMRDAYKRRPNDFKRRVIKRFIDKVEMFLEEQRYLSMIKPEEIRIRYYNLSTNLKHWTTHENDLDIRSKISKSLTGKKQSPETIEKRVSKFRGRVHSEESKLKISNAHKGMKHSEETKNKMRKKRGPMGDEQKQKLREAQQKLHRIKQIDYEF